MADRIGAAWREYRTKVMPLDAPAIQALECRRAFYAGAQAFFTVMLAAASASGLEPTEGDLRLVDDLAAELKAFAASVKEGRA
jgi:hypothetical protein